MKKTKQLVLLTMLLVCSGYVLLNKQFILSTIMTTYYTSHEPFVRVQQANTTVHVEEQQVALAHELLALQNDVHETLSSLLPIEQSSPLSILLVHSEHRAYERYLADDTIGVYFPLLNMMMLDEQANVKQTFIHEYAHYLVDQQLEALVINEEKLPDWFHEGVANYAEYYVLNELPFTYRRFDVKPFHQLVEQQKDNAHTVYHQGFYAIAHLVHMYGNTIITDIIRETNTARDFTNGFSRATNIHLATYEQRFLYDETAISELYELIYTNASTAQQAVAQRNKHNALVNPASEDDLLMQFVLAIEQDERTQLRPLLEKYTFLLDRPSLYVQLANIVATYDSSLAQELLERSQLVARQSHMQ